MNHTNASDAELDEMFEYLNGFAAYDCGATDSGIHHPEKRQEIMEQLMAFDRDTRLLIVGRYLWNYDYEMGTEDEREALRWFRDEGVI